MERAKYIPELEREQAVEIASGMLTEYIKEGWPTDMSYLHVIQQAIHHNIRFDLLSLSEIASLSLEALSVSSNNGTANSQ